MPNVMHRTLSSPTPQTERADPTQVKNNAGGYVFELDPVDAFDRFLILGTDGGTYYCSEKQLTKAGMALVASCAQSLDPIVYAERVIHAGKVAPKRTYALWAIAEALITGNDHLKALAPRMAREVAQTGTDVFELASYVKGRRGWGPAVKNVFDEFLASMPVDTLALWSVKYRNRNGWTWRDLLRQQHTKPGHDPRRTAVFGFMTGKTEPTGSLVIDGYLRAQGAVDEKAIVQLVSEYGLPWEALTDEQRTDDVWKACLPFIGNRAVLRNMASFTRRGLSKDAAFRDAVTARIAGASNLHPVNVLDAMRSYGSGGRLGRSQADTFIPDPRWLESMEDCLTRSFTDGVTATGKRVYVGLDVSGSMGSMASGSVVLSCRDVGAAIALAMVNNEPDVAVFGFTSVSGSSYAARTRGGTAMTHLPFTRRTAFADAVAHVTGMPFGATDCSLPMLHAMEMKANIDTFIVITDNETWAGHVQPMEALRQYRKASGINAQLAVVGLTATNFTIADRRDRATMDFVGFSSDLPKAIEKFMTMT